MINRLIFPKITITKKDFGLSVEAIWPDRLLPKSCSFEDKNIKAWGYGMDYDKHTFEYKAKLLVSKKFKQLSMIDADLLMVVFDKKQNKIFCFTSYTGMFPLYFAREAEKVVLSPDFFEVFNILKSPRLNHGEALDYILQDYLLYQTENTFINGIYKLLPACSLEISGNLDFSIIEGLDFLEFIKNPGDELDPKSATRLIEDILSKQIKKRFDAISEFPLICEMSSGFDCMMVAYLLQKQGVKYEGFNFFTSLNNDDSDPNIVRDWSQKFDIHVNYFDSSDILLYSDDEANKWLASHFFPASHGLELSLEIEKEKKRLFPNGVISFTGNGGDEFLHSADIKQYLINSNKENKKLIFDFSSGSAENIFSQKGLKILRDNDRIDNSYYFPNTFSNATSQQLFFPVHWLTNSWVFSPYDSFEMLKLSQRLPKDKDGHTLHKQDIYRNHTDAFIPSQYRVKLPYHEQVYRFLDEEKETLIVLMKNSILGKNNLIQSEKLLDALQNGSIKELIGENYLSFNNACRLEIFLQSNNIKQ